MTAYAFKSGLSDRNDTSDWFVRFWPPMEGEGNPFLTLVDPHYTGRILREQAKSLSRIAVPQLHEAAEPPDSL
jgi:hypothetical protein